MGRAGINVTTRAIQSDNFVTGASGAGWQLTAEGNLEATSGTFRGALAATSGTIGGFTIAATTLSANASAIVLDSSDSSITAGTLTSTTIRTAASGTRINLNSGTAQFYDGANNDVTLAAGGASDLSITHRGTGNSISVSYAASSARDTFLMLLTDSNQGSDSAISSPVIKVHRTSGSTSIDNLMQVFQEGGTEAVVDIRQHSTAGAAVLRLYQQERWVFVFPRQRTSHT